MNVIQEIKDFVETECKKPTSHYGYDPFIFHFVPVAEYAGQLADELGADKEIAILAAWLHDIGSIVHGREDHDITGAQIAEEKLTELGYPEERMERVKKCILSHRGSKQIKPESLEAQILIEADTLAAFVDIPGLFEGAYTFEKLSRNKAKESIKQKLENKWNQLQFEKSKELVRPKYEAAMLLLE